MLNQSYRWVWHTQNIVEKTFTSGSQSAKFVSFLPRSNISRYVVWCLWLATGVYRVATCTCNCILVVVHVQCMYYMYAHYVGLAPLNVTGRCGSRQNNYFKKLATRLGNFININYSGFGYAASATSMLPASTEWLLWEWSRTWPRKDGLSRWCWIYRCTCFDGDSIQVCSWMLNNMSNFHR